jgi:hypothetical protein
LVAALPVSTFACMLAFGIEIMNGGYEALLEENVELL